MVRPGRTVLDPVRVADHAGPHRPRGNGVPVPRLLGEPDAFVGWDRADAAGRGFEEKLQKLPGCLPVCLLDQLCRGEIARPVNSHKG
jgi:hypothetical protein